MKITNRKKALLGFAASTVLVLGACGESVPVYGLPDDYILESSDLENPRESVPISDDYKEQFYITEIPEAMYKRDEAVYTDKNCPVIREELCYLHVLNKNRDGEILEGELIVNKYIAEDVLDILLKLYEADYRIGNIDVVDNRIVEDNELICSQAIEDNISMCFRTYNLVNHEAKHRLGLALDINPKYNPYMENGAIAPIMKDLIDKYPPDRDLDYCYMIREDDLCVQLFKEHGFEWGGDWEDPKNYMHFEIPDEMVKQWYPGVLGEE